MKIECVKEKLSHAIALSEKISGKNLTLPILSCLFLEAKKSSLIIKSTNLDLGLEIEISAKILQEGSVVLPATVLSSFLVNLQEEKIVLEKTETNLLVSTKNSSTTIKTFPTEDFPIIPKIETSKKVLVSPKVFIEGLKSVWYSAAVTGIKPELSSVYIYAEDENLVFVATDSFRLAEKKISVRKIKDFGAVLIPFKNVSEIIRVLESEKGEINISLESNQMSFSSESFYLVSRVVDGTFPDYKQILPKDHKTEVTLLKQDLINALKIANVFSDTFHQVIFKIIPGEKLFEITTKNNTVGENQNNLDSVLKGEDIIISFNYKYIMDCFQSIQSDSVTLFFQGLGRPLLVRGVSDKSFLYIVMPMNK